MQEPIRDDESQEVSFGPDRLSAALRGELRTLVERLLREELFEALGAELYERTPDRRGYQHSPRVRTITTGVGPVPPYRFPLTPEFFERRGERLLIEGFHIGIPDWP